MKRANIISNAVKVLNEDFYAPMEKIAEAAQVNKRTLYRYFKDRDTLIAACYAAMLETWYDTMQTAINSHPDPVRQLEEMLYAAIDCGVKYLFLTTMESRPVSTTLLGKDKTAQYETARDKWFDIVPDLQARHIIDSQLSTTWIKMFFINTVRTSVQALHSGDIVPNDLKRIAWLCFRRSIGIRSEN